MSVFISAGEHSGEGYGKELLLRLSEYLKCEYYCLFHGEISRAGAIPVISDTDLLGRKSSDVVGLSEAFNVIPSFFFSLLRVKRFLKEYRPKLVILIDYPEFNMRIAKYAKKYGSTVIYLAPPQVWAWREWRVLTLRRYVDESIVLLPFELEYYSMKAVRATFLGHPLIDRLHAVLGNSEEIVHERIGNGLCTIGILPGSRLSEWNHHLPILLQVMRSLISRFTQVRFVLPLPRQETPSLDRLLMEAMELFADVFERVIIVRENRYHMLKSCDAAVVASGTATLEIALLDVPMVVFYRVSSISGILGRCLIKVPFAAQPNLLIGKPFVPELLQDRAVPELITEFASHVLTCSETRELQKLGFKRIRESLGGVGVWNRIAYHILKMVTNKGAKSEN